MNKITYKLFKPFEWHEDCSAYTLFWKKKIGSNEYGDYIQFNDIEIEDRVKELILEQISMIEDEILR